MFRFFFFFIPVFFILELYIFVKISVLIGFIWALFLVFATGILGLPIVKLEGRHKILDLHQKLVEGKPSEIESLESVAILVAGLLILVPGFLSDFLGVLLLLPIIRKTFIRLIVNRMRGSERDIYTEDADRWADERFKTNVRDVSSIQIIEGEYVRKEENE